MVDVDIMSLTGELMNTVPELDYIAEKDTAVEEDPNSDVDRDASDDYSNGLNVNDVDYAEDIIPVSPHAMSLRIVQLPVCYVGYITAPQN